MGWGKGREKGEEGKRERKEKRELKKNSTEEREGRKKKADHMLPSKTTHVK